jgi:1-acyl-sn-glycerol-3-phosphate acyltransferase
MIRKWIDYPGFLWIPYSFVCGGILILSVLFWGTLVIVRSMFPISAATQDWYLLKWMKFTCWLYRIRYEVYGQDNHIPTQPSLVIANHQSLFDIPFAFIALGGNLRMLAKKELFEVPVFGRTMRVLGFIYFDRRSPKSGKNATNQIRDRILSGYHVWVAPEGTRSDSNDLLPFKKGSFGVAIEAQVPVQPIVVEGSYQTCPKRTLLVRPGVFVKIHVLPRISPTGYTLDSREELCDVTRMAMHQVISGETKKQTFQERSSEQVQEPSFL